MALTCARRILLSYSPKAEIAASPPGHRRQKCLSITGCSFERVLRCRGGWNEAPPANPTHPTVSRVCARTRVEGTTFTTSAGKGQRRAREARRLWKSGAGEARGASAGLISSWPSSTCSCSSCSWSWTCSFSRRPISKLSWPCFPLLPADSNRSGATAVPKSSAHHLCSPLVPLEQIGYMATSTGGARPPIFGLERRQSTWQRS